MTTNAQRERASHSQAEEPGSDFPVIPRLENISGVDPRRASELIAETRSSVEKGNNKELKELLGKFDRGMGFQASTSSRSR
jgi:hypothetical protein